MGLEGLRRHTVFEHVWTPLDIAEQYYSNKGSIYGVATDDYWIDAGRPELYRAANLDLLDGARRFERCDPIAPTATVAPSATIVNSIVGAGASVADGSTVTDSVVLPHAVVGVGAVGRHFALHLSRLAIDTLWLVDRGRY